MATNDPEIKDGFSLPVWMKTRPTKDYEPFAASPPGPEETFFYIKYPKTDSIFGKQKVEDFKPILQEQSKVVTAATYNPREKDWSKHTKPCQDVLHGITQSSSIASSAKGSKSDDEMKGEGAACGNSVVKVAHKMTSKRGFTVASPIDDPTEDAAKHYNFARRGSKSLPTTPVHSPPSSPNSRRKKNGNRYFTSPFEPVSDANNRSWLSMALLGFKKDLAGSTSTLAEEDAVEVRLQGVSLAESVENLGPAPKVKEAKPINNDVPTQQPPLNKNAQAFRPKPSELREMNFWSPTSM